MKKVLNKEVTSYINGMIEGTQARVIQELDKNWRFYPGDGIDASAVEFDDTLWRSLDIPHDYSVEADFSEEYPANGYVPSGVLWYRKNFRLPSEHKHKKIFLLFDGVSMNSQVWINGRHLGLHPYAYTPFWYDITPFVNFGNTEGNTIAIKADCSLQPFGRSYGGAGLFRNVRLVAAYPLHIEQWGVTWELEGTPSEEAEITVRTGVRVDRYPETVWNAFSWQGGTERNNHIVKDCSLVTSIVDREGNIVGEVRDTAAMPAFGKQTFRQKVKIANPSLWSPENPYMYTIHSYVLMDGKVVDDTLTPLGIRSIAFDAVNGFRLNGTSIKLKGVCLHQDAGIHGGAVPVGTWVRKLSILKEAGCNAIRTAHHPFPAEFYHVCDYLGFMVMDEAFDEWQQGWDRGLVEGPYGKNTYGYHLYFEQWCETDLRAMLKRDRNHPCVVMWSVGNEIPELYFPEGIDILKKLARICKEEDATRPVTVCAEGNHLLRIHEGIMEQVDIAGYNYVNSREGDAWYEKLHTASPHKVLLGSETEYEPEHWKAISENPYVIGQFLWVGYDYLGEGADVLGEDAELGFTFDISALSDNRDSKGQRILRHGWAFGLVDSIDTPKGEYFFRKSIWGSEPMVQLAVKPEIKENKKSYGYFQSHLHWNWNPGDLKSIYCFTNCEKVELFLNGRSIGLMEKDPESVHALEFDIAYEPGVLTAIGYIGEARACESSLATAGEACCIKLLCDNQWLQAGGKDTVCIYIGVVDDKGVVVPDADNNINVKVNGSGSLLGVLSADMTSNTGYRAGSCKAYKGRCMAVIRAAENPGEVAVMVEGAGLAPASLTIKCE